MSNPFKIIESTEEAPKDLKVEVMKSTESAVLMLRFVQLFVGDYTAAALAKLKIEPKEDQDNTNLE